MLYGLVNTVLGLSFIIVFYENKKADQTNLPELKIFLPYFLREFFLPDICIYLMFYKIFWVMKQKIK
jgi:hypothetical protein